MILTPFHQFTKIYKESILKFGSTYANTCKQPKEGKKILWKEENKQKM